MIPIHQEDCSFAAIGMLSLHYNPKMQTRSRDQDRLRPRYITLLRNGDLVRTSGQGKLGWGTPRKSTVNLDVTIRHIRIDRHLTKCPGYCVPGRWVADWLSRSKLRHCQWCVAVDVRCDLRAFGYDEVFSMHEQEERRGWEEYNARGYHRPSHSPRMAACFTSLRGFERCPFPIRHSDIIYVDIRRVAQVSLLRPGVLQEGLGG